MNATDSVYFIWAWKHFYHAFNTIDTLNEPHALHYITVILKGLSPSFKSSNFTQVGRSRAPATAGRGIHGPPDPRRGRRRGRHRGRRRGRRRPPVMYRGGKRLDGGVLPWKIHDKWFYGWENVRTWSRHGEFSSGSWPCPLDDKIGISRWRNANFHCQIMRVPLKNQHELCSPFYKVPQIPRVCLLTKNQWNWNRQPFTGHRINRLPSFFNNEPIIFDGELAISPSASRHQAAGGTRCNGDHATATSTRQKLRTTRRAEAGQIVVVSLEVFKQHMNMGIYGWFMVFNIWGIMDLPTYGHSLLEKLLTPRTFGFIMHMSYVEICRNSWWRLSVETPSRNHGACSGDLGIFKGCFSYLGDGIIFIWDINHLPIVLSIISKMFDGSRLFQVLGGQYNIG